MPPKLTPEIIKAAVDGFEAQKTRIDGQIQELRALLSGGSAEPAATSEAPKRKRWKMSAAGRRAIAEAQRKRWAASKKAAEPSIPKAAPKPKRKLSRAGRAAIIATTKKRWERCGAEAARKSASRRKAATRAARTVAAETAAQ